MVYRWCIFFVSLFIFIQCDHYGPFRKYRSLEDRPSPYGCNRTKGVSLRSTRRAVNDLYVSSTSYVSNEEISVTWNGTLISCADDFIGIYFIEIPLFTGKLDSFHCQL